MTNPTHEAQTVREMQQLAVAALDELLSLDLPELSWSLSVHYRCPELSAQLCDRGESDDKKRDGVRRWAQFLNSEVVESIVPNEFTEVRVIGSYENVKVRVWTAVDRAER